MSEIIMVILGILLFLVICAGVFILVLLPVRFLRFSRDKRYLHGRMIILAGLFMLAGFNVGTFGYLSRLIDWIRDLGPVRAFFEYYLPQQPYQLTERLIFVILLNLLFVICMDIVLLIIYLCSLKSDYIDFKDKNALFKIIHFPWLLANVFYHPVNNRDSYRVTEKGSINYYWIKGMKYAFPVLAGIQIAAIYVGIYINRSNLNNIIYEVSLGWYLLPLAGFIMFLELQYFFESDHIERFNAFQSDDIEMQQSGLIKDLVSVYEQLFDNNSVLIKKYIPQNANILVNGLKYSGITNVQISACDQPHILTFISNQLKSILPVTNRNYQNAIISLLNGESISVRDFLQGEIMIYLCAYINFCLTEGKTFLVLCSERERAEAIRESMRKSMSMLNQGGEIWTIGGIKEADDNETLHILVCGFQDLVGHKLLSKRKKFFVDLKTVIIDRASAFCAFSNIHKDMILSELTRISGRHQYILVSEVESTALETSFGNYIGQEILPYKNLGRPNGTNIMIWAEESNYKIQKALGIGSDISEYMGVSITLALVALKWQFPLVHIYAGAEKPIKSYYKALNTNTHEILKYLERNVDYYSLLQINDYNDIMNKNNLDMMVLYDENFNLVSLIWLWIKYGGKKETLIHIVSPAYMLRDYFAENIEKLLNRENDYAPLISWRSGLDASRFHAMLLKMSNAGMYDSEVMEKKREYGWKYKSIGSILKAALNSVLGGARSTYNIYESFDFQDEMVFNELEDRFESRVRIMLTDNTIIEELKKQTSFARINQKSTGTIEEIPVLSDNLTNYFLRDQVVSINGSLKNIISIEDGVLYAENVSAETRESYYQVSQFSWEEESLTDKCVDLDILDFNMYIAKNVTRTIYGYWTSCEGISLQSEGAMQFNRVYSYNRGFDRSADLKQEKKNVQIMEIRIPVNAMKRFCGDDGEGYKGMVFLLTFMLGEIFKTLFPDTYMNLFALNRYDASAEFWEKLFGDTSLLSPEEKIRSMIPFTNRKKKRETENDEMEEFTSIYILEYSSVELGMITSLYVHRKRVFRIIYDYLCWYTSFYNDGTEGKKGFLHFGMNNIPACFAADALMKFCEYILPKIQDSSDESTAVKINPQNYCSFCGSPTVFWNTLSDGRRMCNECANQMISQEDEIKKLFDDVVRNMFIHYGVKIPDNVFLRFASAESIRKKIGSRDETERVLGFCERKGKGRKRSIYIEARGPRNSVMSTLIHELTHFWQFDEFGPDRLKKIFKANELKMIEGHAVYVQIHAMREFGEAEYADAMEREYEIRTDVYGEGFRYMREQMNSAEMLGSHNNPFKIFEEIVNNEQV